MLGYSWMSLMTGAQKLVSANLFPSAVELLSSAFAAEAGFAEHNEALLVIRFAGSREAVEIQSLETGRLLESYGRLSGGPLVKVKTSNSGAWCRACQ